MRISCTSGKGGTGKTFVTLNLARTLKDRVTILDCDVEEPNCNLFLQGEKASSERFSVLVPQLIEDKCTGCRICADVCEFNAIVMLGGKPYIMEDLCHSCAACSILCPEKALIEVDNPLGDIHHYQKDSIHLIEGRLDIGKALAVPLIRHVKKRGLETTYDHLILDSPPGTSCPMVWTIDESDVVILVAESTAFGLHDLQLAIATIQEVGLPYGVVINKEGMGDDRVEIYCHENNIPILAKIPFDREIAIIVSESKILVDEKPEYKKLFESMWEQMLLLKEHSDGN
ncbi:MAG: ATP-binding protein [Sphaerochaetaceae bacterium]